MRESNRLKAIIDALTDSLDEIPFDEAETEYIVGLRKECEEKHYKITGHYYRYKRERDNEKD